MHSLFGMSLPEWIGDCVLEDRLFSRAYAGMPASGRAWIKTLAAGLHPLWAPHGLAVQAERTAFDNGFVVSGDIRPAPAAVLFLDETLVSPAQAAAAALPAVLAGPSAVLAVRLGPGAGRADGVLAALELCGLEYVCRLDRARSLDLLVHLAGLPGRAAVLALGAGRAIRLLAAKALELGLATWRAEPPGRIGAFDPDRVLDLAALAAAHPGAELEAWTGPGRAKALPDGVRQRAGSFEEFLEQDYGVVAAPPDMAARALERFWLVLGPGAEGCFAWPDLSRELFLRRGLGLRREA